MFSRSALSMIRTAAKSVNAATMRGATRGFATVAANTARTKGQHFMGVGTGCVLGFGFIQVVDTTVGISPNSAAINPQTRTISAAAAAEKGPPSLLKVRCYYVCTILFPPT